jgi:transcription termination factor Rho
MQVPRRIFGCARKIENGGSLSILATVLIETGSRMDEVIFEEFKGTGNMEIVLSREIANHRIFPAIDIGRSATRKSELLVDADEYQKMEIFRRHLAGLGRVEAAQALVNALQKHPSNQELLSSLKT